ncbi:GNAT family N-acetyltransferase [Shimia sp. MIT1388]|uniref:GNAT family N-acetyltransferase n=1 Tax=Shimia sp. MIT1388 TaxID=3096992 RepID=UPI00399BC659
MTSSNIVAATEIPREHLREAMNVAFSDYAVPMQLTQDAFDRLLAQRGFVPEVSRVAMLDGEVAAFWLVGRRGDAAYLISSGTRPAHRGKGLSTEIGLAVLAGLRGNGATSLQMEVLENNVVAQSLYKRLGLTQHRQLGCCHIMPPKDVPPSVYSIVTRPWSETAAFAESAQDWAPSWQHSSESLAALGEDVMCLCAEKGQQVIGCVAVITSTLTVAQIAVDPRFRRQGVARALLAACGEALEAEELRLINFDTGDAGFSSFVRTLDTRPRVGQFELHMLL